MSAVAGVIGRLESLVAVTGLVGTRIYQGILPEHPTFPAIRVQRIGENEAMHMRGTSGVFRTRVQVDSISNAADAVGVAQAVDAVVRGNGATTGLIGWRGTAAGVVIHSILPADMRESYDPEDRRQYRVMRDVFVTWVQ